MGMRASRLGAIVNLAADLRETNCCTLVVDGVLALLVALDTSFQGVLARL